LRTASQISSIEREPPMWDFFHFDHVFIIKD
jgi:hypothetical protein